MKIVNIDRNLLLVEEFSEEINGNEMIRNVTLNDYGIVCKSCIIYIVLLVIVFFK